MTRASYAEAHSKVNPAMVESLADLAVAAERLELHHRVGVNKNETTERVVPALELVDENGNKLGYELRETGAGHWFFFRRNSHGFWILEDQGFTPEEGVKKMVTAWLTSTFAEKMGAILPSLFPSRHR